MSFELDRVHKLLNVIDLAKQWPLLKGLHDSAMKELTKISFEEGKQLAVEAKAEAEALVQKRADEVKAAQARADAEAKANEAKPKPESKMVPIPSPADDPVTTQRPDGMPEPTPQGLIRP